MGHQGGSRDHRLADLSVSPPSEPDRWYPPPPDEREELDPYTIFELDEPKVRIFVRMTTRLTDDRLVDFNISLQVWAGGRWDDVCRADTTTHRPGVHYHWYDAAGREEVQTFRDIRSQQDIEEGYDEALRVIEEHWTEHLRRWERGGQKR